MNLRALIGLIDGDLVYDYFLNKGLINPPEEGSLCRNCGTGKMNKQKCDSFPGFEFRCRNHQCRQRIKISSTSWLLYNVKLPWSTILLIIYCWSMQYTTSQAEHEIKCNKNTITSFFSKLRYATHLYCILHSKTIGGPGHIIEIDETCMVKRKYNRGRYTESMHTWYFGGIDRTTRDFFIVQVPDRKKKTLVPIIRSMIIQGTTIYSDSWSSYKKLCDEGYYHDAVNHSIGEFVNPDDHSINTQLIESTWSGLKRFMKKKGEHKDGNIGNYMSEYYWRRKRKLEDPDMFQAALQLLASLVPQSDEYEEFEETQ